MDVDGSGIEDEYTRSTAVAISGAAFGDEALAESDTGSDDVVGNDDGICLIVDECWTTSKSVCGSNCFATSVFVVGRFILDDINGSICIQLNCMSLWIKELNTLKTYH